MPRTLPERVTALEADVLDLIHVDRTQAHQITELKDVADRTLTAVGELLQDMHGVDARLTVLEHDVAELKQDVHEIKTTQGEHTAMLRQILDRLPPR